MDDLISRQAMIDAISTLDKFGADERNRIIRWNEGLEPYVQLRDVLNVIVNLPSAQSEPCEDAVSRLAVRHTLCKAVHKDSKVCDYVREIDRLPSVHPEIIRCKDCTKMQVDEVFHDFWCSETKQKVWLDHYCGYAERRNDG